MPSSHLGNTVVLYSDLINSLRAEISHIDEVGESLSVSCTSLFSLMTLFVSVCAREMGRS